MKFGIYVVQDVKAGYGSPITDVNDGVALRAFTQSVNDSMQKIMYFSPEDFRLWKIGEYESDFGKITSFEVPELICDGASVKKGD